MLKVMELTLPEQVPLALVAAQALEGSQALGVLHQVGRVGKVERAAIQLGTKTLQEAALT